MYNFDLWKISGHADHYKENMFCIDIEKAEFGLKPMNCPGPCCMPCKPTPLVAVGGAMQGVRGWQCGVRHSCTSAMPHSMLWLLQGLGC